MRGANFLTDGPFLPVPADPRRRRASRWAIRLGLAGLAAWALVWWHAGLLTGFARWFRVDDPAPSDALVVLLGGANHRPKRAAELFRAGLAPRILVADSATDPQLGFGETALSRRLLLQEGVPASALEILPGPVGSTRDEAVRVRDYARAHPDVRRITVVTSSYHTARARWVFRRVLRGSGVEVRMAAARPPDFDESDWYRYDEGMVMYFSEAIKTLYYRLVY